MFVKDCEDYYNNIRLYIAGFNNHCTCFLLHIHDFYFIFVVIKLYGRWCVAGHKTIYDYDDFHKISFNTLHPVIQR